MSRFLRWTTVATTLFAALAHGMPHSSSSSSSSTAPWLGPAARQSPLSLNMTQSGPAYDVLAGQTLTGMAINSHWTIYYITTTSNLNLALLTYCVIHESDPPGMGAVASSLYDIDGGSYQSFQLPAAPFSLSSTGLDIQFDDYYRFHATTSDNFTSMNTWANRDGISYNLTFQPNGPNLYDGGSGIFFWGTGITYEWAAPRSIVTGSVTFNGAVHEVDTARSSAWYDRQWGPGRAANGWYWFPIRLDNDLSIAVWATVPVNGRSNTYGTVLYPNGNGQVFSVSPDFQWGGPWVSSKTNITYYSSCRITVPDRGYFDVTLPHAQERQYGELTAGILASTIYEGYAVYEGVWDGQPAKGWGLSEQKIYF